MSDLSPFPHAEPPTRPRFPLVAKIILSVVAAHLIVILILSVRGSLDRQKTDKNVPEAEENVPKPIVEEEPPFRLRPFPATFPRRSCMPDMREAEACGSISNSLFSPGRDLVFVDDSRVWWESEFDGDTDDECDHTMHRGIEAPFRRLVELVCASNATLRVQECYRPTGIHSGASLHKEGRALDLTCPDLDPSVPKTSPTNPDQVLPTPLSLEILAKLCWAAGFDWVYYEVPRNSGAHLHVSMRRDAPAMRPYADDAPKEVKFLPAE